MRVQVLSRLERVLLITTLAVACLVGACAAYGAHLAEAEAQFHGGVLPEDAAEAEFALVWEPASAFARWSGGVVLALGVGPLAVMRWFAKRAK